MPDSPLSDEEKAKWATYRQELRDLPISSSSPKYDKHLLIDVTWPIKPE